MTTSTPEFTVSVTDLDGFLLREEQFDTLSQCELFCRQNDSDDVHLDVVHPDGTRECWS